MPQGEQGADSQYKQGLSCCRKPMDIMPMDLGCQVPLAEIVVETFEKARLQESDRGDKKKL